MKIVLASSEAVPFSKTGGLADVASALSKALAGQGHDVWLVVPHYSSIGPVGGADIPNLEATGHTLDIPVGPKRVEARILTCKLPGSSVTVLLVDQPAYFERNGLYQENGNDFKDNCERFVFFSRAVIEAVHSLDIRPDVIHVNDWQTGLVPALLDIEYKHLPGFEKTVSVFTIHNMAFQGQFWHWDMLLTGLDWKYFNWQQLEFFNHLNLLKTGIVFSDAVTTVSPTYSREIKTQEFGCGLEGVLTSLGDRLVGILNGVDTEIWNPETDQALPQNYSLQNVRAGKAACKRSLQQKMGLPLWADLPLFGMITRMTGQKGLDLLVECSEILLELDLQLCFLGTGEEKYERFLEDLSLRHPKKVAVKIGFDDGLAHQIEAGSDVYLMPSRYEPCGLNQMYSLMYGTVPIVRAVGGLADSVVDATDENMNNGTATGFSFDAYDEQELVQQVRRAVKLFNDQKRWAALVENGMSRDWSWSRSAAEYSTLYERTIKQADIAAHATTP